MITTTATRTLVECIINKWTFENIAFTAFDITSYLRSKGYQARHQAVNDYVKAIHRDLGIVDASGVRYETHLINIDNVHPSPFLYHPNGFSLNDYDPDWLNSYDFSCNDSNDSDNSDNSDNSETLSDSLNDAVMLVTTNNSNFPKNLNIPNGKNSVYKKRIKLRSDGRLNVPQELMGHSPIVSLTIAPTNDFMELSIPLPSNAGKLICRDRDGRIRLSANIVNQIKKSDYFEVEKNGDKTIISPS